MSLGLRKSFHVLFLSGICLREYKIPYRSRNVSRSVSEGYDYLIENLNSFSEIILRYTDTLRSVYNFGLKIEMF